MSAGETPLVPVSGERCVSRAREDTAAPAATGQNRLQRGRPRTFPIFFEVPPNFFSWMEEEHGVVEVADGMRNSALLLLKHLPEKKLY